MRAKKVIAYVDVFNLYFGLRDKEWRCYYWLNIKLLCENLLKTLPGPHHLILVKYFTSRITSPPDKKKRQSTFIEALNTMKGIKPYYGKYQLTPFECEKCGHQSEIPEEKMTDVQIATELVSDAYQNNYDTALLVTADRDLVPSVEKIRSKFPHKSVIVVFPPMRTNDDLRAIASKVLHITEPILKKSLLPEEIPKLSGYILTCPREWH